MGRVQERIAAVLAAEVASRTEWDEPPGLWFLYLRGGEPVLSQVEIPDFIWATGPPPAVLAALAEGLGEFSGFLRASAPEGLHGAGFYCETWTVMQPPAGTAERSELMADAMARRVWTRADRVEARSMWAVDRAGAGYSVLMRRDLDAAPHTQVTAAGPGRRLADGVHLSLERMVTAMLAVTIPGGP